MSRPDDNLISFTPAAAGSTIPLATGLPPRFFPSKGVKPTHAIQIVHEITDKFRISKTDENSPFITVYHYSDHDLKHELYLGRIVGILAACEPR